ncbi:hypothetical protein RR48_08611 [Papilio machaon]|uniref:Uncharacterized protein n=1 Tax=Papilio machaon TaxID=76193 RepID=A0A194RJA9_PAPMA|nr:hypothetical protein RR48_08611 [Papilio machaon]
MSLLGSTSKCGGSQHDLTKSSEGGKIMDKPQITFRKHKELEPDLRMKEEFESLKKEMRSFLTKFSTILQHLQLYQNDYTDFKYIVEGI